MWMYAFGVLFTYKNLHTFMYTHVCVCVCICMYLYLYSKKCYYHAKHNRSCKDGTIWRLFWYLFPLRFFTIFLFLMFRFWCSGRSVSLFFIFFKHVYFWVNQIYSFAYEQNACFGDMNISFRSFRDILWELVLAVQIFPISYDLSNHSST